MSSDPRSDAPSHEPDSPDPPPDAASIRKRGSDLLDGLETKLPGSRAHAGGTAGWALAIAVEHGLAWDHGLAVRETARLHEVGKLYIEAELLERHEDEMSNEERRRLDRQADVAGRLAAGSGLPSVTEIWLSYWRERFDGRGPNGLFGEAIPIESRIIRTACVFEAALRRQDRPEGGDSAAALNEITELANNVLDPALVEALSRIIGRAAGAH